MTSNIVKCPYLMDDNRENDRCVIHPKKQAVFKVFVRYDDEYEFFHLKMNIMASCKEEALQKFKNICKQDIQGIRQFLDKHPKLEDKRVNKLIPCTASFYEYYDLDYVSDPNLSYHDYLGPDIPPNEKNYKEYLIFKKDLDTMYDKWQKYFNDEEKQKEYNQYLKRIENEVEEENKNLLSDEFILDFFEKLETYVSEIPLNKVERRVIRKYGY